MIELALEDDRQLSPEALDRENIAAIPRLGSSTAIGRRAPLPTRPVERIAARRGRNILVLPLAEVWAFEARERLCFVHSLHGRFDVDSSLVELEEALEGRRFLRVHRRWLASVDRVRAYETFGKAHDLVIGTGLGAVDPCIRVPVSRELASIVRARLLAGCIGHRLARGTS